MNLPKKPLDLFDREQEWRNLTTFSADPAAELLLGVVWGRRRQGKSYLLQALTEATGGFYYEAVAGTSADLLLDLGTKVAEHMQLAAPLRFDTWDAALSALSRLATHDAQPKPVVLDEFPFLAAAEPSLPSLVARLLSARGPRRESSRVRLILCGSALRFMLGLLGGSAPLRGRAGLEQVIRGFDFRMARRYWQLEDPRLALLTFVVVGGTPAYRRELLRGDTPTSLRDFDAWVCRTALEPASALFREGRVLVEEEPALNDMGLYHSVLGAIAAGEHNPTRIAGRVGKPQNALAHVLGALCDTGLVTRHVEPLHKNRTTYRITEPIVAFHHAIMRPSWANLERGRASEVWQRAKPTFSAKLVGPTFERVCREWLESFASEETTGGPLDYVGSAKVPDPGQRVTHEIDVLGLEGKRVRVIGEAKWSERPSAQAIARLEHVRDLLAARGFDVQSCRLMFFTGEGVVRRASKIGGGEVVELERLYEGN